jgi:hypothetical protein
MSEFLEWLTAVGTAGAFVVAAVIFFTSTRAATLDRRQAQAVLVDAWIKSVTKYAEMHTLNCEVSNHSDQAIRDVNIVINDDQLPMGWIETISVVPPTVRGEFLKVSIQIPTTTEKAPMSELLLQGLYRMTMSFRDRAGRTWIRSEGKLVEGGTWHRSRDLQTKKRRSVNPLSNVRWPFSKTPSAGQKWRGTEKLE